ncbi:MAG: hypothetical protein L0Y64_25280, partial [Myxococcaceae bacterium]|nr:hypothetical protein [Myxococcaceae bacterium]
MDALATMDGSSMTGAMQVASQLARSGLIPKTLQGKPQDVLVVLLTGKELGLGPMQSLRGIHVVDGKAVLSADLIVGLCVRERSVCRYFRLLTSTDKEAVYETHREGAPEATRLSFTLAQAQQANLTGKQNWRQYPAAMLRARCAAALARAVFPDLMAGVYDPDELEHAKHEPTPEAEAGRRARLTVSEEPPAANARELPASTVTVDAPPALPAEAQATAERVARAVGGEVVEKPAAAVLVARRRVEDLRNLPPRY